MAFASFIFGFSASDVIYFSIGVLPCFPEKGGVGDAQRGNRVGYFLFFGEFISFAPKG